MNLHHANICRTSISLLPPHPDLAGYFVDLKYKDVHEPHPCEVKVNEGSSSTILALIKWG
jgi:hypothetical protein